MEKSINRGLQNTKSKFHIKGSPQDCFLGETYTWQEEHSDTYQVIGAVCSDG